MTKVIYPNFEQFRNIALARCKTCAICEHHKSNRIHLRITDSPPVQKDFIAVCQTCDLAIKEQISNKKISPKDCVVVIRNKLFPKYPTVPPAIRDKVKYIRMKNGMYQVKVNGEKMWLRKDEYQELLKDI